MHPYIGGSTLPGQRLHIDFAGPVQRKMLLVVVIDAPSKWPEIVVMENTTAEETVSILCSLFAGMGVSEHIVAYNGPHLTSDTLRSFHLRTVLGKSLVHLTTRRPLVRSKD